MNVVNIDKQKNVYRKRKNSKREKKNHAELLKEAFRALDSYNEKHIKI